MLRATKLVKTGEGIEMAHVLAAGMPISDTRQFNIHVKRTLMNPQSNRRGSNEELVSSEIGQVGTQFDGFTHQTIGDSLYNCVKLDDVQTRTGFTKLGIENVGSLIARGVMIDVAGLKGVDMLPDTYEITVPDLQPALAKQNLKLQPGDAVIIHTGWGRLWGKDNARYIKTCPGRRRRRRRVAREAGPDARRRGQLAGRGRAEPGHERLAAGAPDLPRGERDPHSRKSEARRWRPSPSDKSGRLRRGAER